MILTDKFVIPNDSLLLSTLGTTFPFFKKLEELTEFYKKEWKYYNIKSGWTYKVSNKNKALFYITPLKDNFNINFGIRENEKDMLLNNQISKEIREKLLSAEKYPEGYALRLNIKNENDFKNL